MSKKRTSKKKAPKTPRKGAKRAFKGHGKRRGISRSTALSNKAKRERAQANATASAKALSSADAKAKKKTAKAKFDQNLKAADSGEGQTVTPPPGSGTKKWKRRGKKKVAAPAQKTAPKTSAKSKPGKKKRKVSKVIARRRYRQGRAVLPKYKLMHKFGLPRRGKVAPEKKRELRRAAGYDAITFRQIMDTIQSEKLKGWVCVGPKRTGCGGGSKNLRGGHQIGIYASGHAR